MLEVVGKEKRTERRRYQYIYLISLYFGHASVASLAWPDVSMTYCGSLVNLPEQAKTSHSSRLWLGISQE